MSDDTVTEPKQNWTIQTGAGTPVPQPAISIPEELRECRFIKLRRHDKAAIEKGWQNDRNYGYDDPEILQHIDYGGNYGIMPAGGICIFDADNIMKLSDLDALGPFLNTYFVKTGGEGIRGHFYFHCPDFPGTKKIILYDPETGEELGDLRPPGCKAYCVGPTCIHPSGKTYDARRDYGVKEISFEDVQEHLYSKVLTDEERRKRHNEGKALKRIHKSKESLVDMLDLTVQQFLDPVNPRPRDNQIEGEHPVHGSETGTNFVVDPIQNIWYCRRHNSGGGPLEALAVSEGIIDCADAGTGCLEGHWPQVFEALKKYGYGDKLEGLKERRADYNTKKESNTPLDEDDTGAEVPEEIRAEALSVLTTGDPLQKFRETFRLLHSGDLEVCDTILLAQCAQAGLTTQGIQPVLSGNAGAGKTSSVQASLHLSPPEYLISGSFSDKSLFYDPSLKPGCVIFSDDTELRQEILSTIKRAMSSFQETTQHRTVVKEHGRNVMSVLEIPPRQIFLFTSVQDVGDDQLGTRQYRVSVEQTPSNDRDFLKFTMERIQVGRELYPVTKDVAICRDIIRQIKDNKFRVRIPFAERIDFTDLSSKRNILMFFDFIMAAAILRFMQRERSESDADGIITLAAGEDDFYTARDVFQTNEETRKFDLTKSEKALLDFIVDRGGEITEQDLIRQYFDNGKRRDANRMKIRRLLYGKDNNGGLLGKVPGMTVEKQSRVVGEDNRRNVNVISAPSSVRSTLSDYAAWVTLKEST